MQPSEEVDGILNRETGEYFPPLWFTKLKEKCEKEPDRMHVLFIDELTNVSPTVQSLIYTIVYDREGKDGLWPLPENSVVIAAGNEEDGNKAAYPLTNALFRRFAHLYYEVDVDRWVDWATSINTNEVSVYNRINKDDKTKRAKIHPALLAYVKSRGKDVLNQPLDEDNPSIVTDPRKWEMASNVLYSTNNPYSLKPCIGEELTKDFVSFVKTAQLTVEDILNDSFSADKLMLMSLSEKYSSLLNLSLVDEDNLPKIRNVISQCFGGELRSVFDLMWIRNDPERALILADLNSSMEA